MSDKTYQWNAGEYARHSSGQFQWAQELIGKLALRGSEHVLDIGCGDGKVTAAIASSLPAGSVTGVDLAWGMVALAKEQFGQLPNLRVAQMDAACLGFSHYFDVAFSNAVLHWVKDHRGLLAGVARSLRPAGRLLFQMGGQGNASEIVAVMDAIRARAAWQDYFHNFEFPYCFYGLDEYTQLLSEAGFAIIRIDLLPKDMQHAGREGLSGWLRTTWMPYLSRVPTGQQDAFLGEVLDEYLRDHPADEQGIVHVKMVRLEVEAVL